MRETWFVLEDGDVADPNECAPDEKGDLRHASGAYVAKRGDTYSSRGVDVEAVRAKVREMAAATTDKPATADREIKPAPAAKGYRTRAT